MEATAAENRINYNDINQNHQTMWDKETFLNTFHIRKLYREYNAKYFKGKLGDCVFDLYVQGDDEPPSLAYTNAHKKRNGGYAGFIKFNAKSKWDEKSVNRVLLHEMIHYYHLVILRRPPFFAHGIHFIASQLRLLLTYGIYVPRRGRWTLRNVQKISKKKR